MTDDDARWSWHDQRGVTWAAGVAAVALIGLLVVAVLRVSSGSPLWPEFGPSVPVQVTSEETPISRTTSPTSSYTLPSAQTTELDPGPLPGTSTDGPLPEDPATSSTSTTLTNPYVTTTTQNGGAV